MGFRFSKRISILPGVRLNLSGSGASVSLGPRGASITMGKRGVYGNVGIPGTGLSYRERLDKPSPPASRPRAPSRSPAPEPQIPPGLTAKLVGNQLVFEDGAGRGVDTRILALIKRTMKDEIREFLQENAEARNAAATSLGMVHLDIPASVARLAGGSSGKPEPREFVSHEQYVHALMTWRAARANEGPDQTAIEDALLSKLGALAWPRETNIAIAFSAGRLLLDVDLPELEDMPDASWEIDMANLALRSKPLSQKARAEQYLEHVCSLVLRLIGHSMAVTDAIGTVAISAYTQRSGTLGRISDEYVATVEVARACWASVDLAGLQAIEPHNLLRHLGANIATNGRGIFLVQQPLT